MTLARHYIKQLNKADSEMEKVAQDAIKDDMEFILFLIKEKQLHLGIKSDGSDAPNYSKWTQFFAKSNPPRTGVSSKTPDNKFNYDWSGSWMESLYIKIESDGFDILSRDGKTAILEQMSGGKITKLTEENNQIINEEIIKPALYEHLFNTLLE